MSKSIVLQWGGEESSFSFTKLERDKLYGRKHKVVVDGHGAPVTTAHLTQDGSALVPVGGIAQLYVDAEWNAYEVENRIAVDESGEPLPALPSTLGVPREARKVDANRVLDCAIESVYQLDPETLGKAMQADLQDGSIFETTFSYRGGAEADPMFLLQNEAGYFALVGRETRFEYLRHELPPSDGFAEDELDEELDFTMM